MKKIILEFPEALYIDRDYYGYAEINAPMLFVSKEEKLSSEELKKVFLNNLNLDSVYEGIESLLEFINVEGVEKEIEKNKNKRALNKKQKIAIQTSIKSLKILNMETIELERKKEELQKEFEELKEEEKNLLLLEKDNKDKVDFIYSKIDKDQLLLVEKLLEGRNLLLFLKNNQFKNVEEVTHHFNIDFLIMNVQFKEYIEFLVKRGFKYVDLSIVDVKKESEEGVYQVEEIYEKANEFLNKILKKEDYYNF